MNKVKHVMQGLIIIFLLINLICFFIVKGYFLFLLESFGEKLGRLIE